MPHTPPVALILFSNDMDRFLPSVERERKIIEEALEHFGDSNRLKVIARSSVSIEEIFRLFHRYRGRIALFHFAGHAGGNGLQLNQNFEDAELGRAVGLADLFRMEVEKGMLQLVFLNGCSTQPQLDLLKEVGVPSVISTRYPIEDRKALSVAQQFYHCLANTGTEAPFQNLPTVQEAFQHAIAYIKTSYAIQEKGQSRDLVFDMTLEGEIDNETAWHLYSSHPDWRLSAEVAEESKPFNKYLTAELIQAIQPHNERARKLLAYVQTHHPNWEEIDKITDKAKSILAQAYVSVLGLQLRKLFSIGKDSLSEQKKQQYLQNCTLTAKRALQLLCFALLSSLWDRKKDQPGELPSPHRQSVENFFENKIGLDIPEYVKLLQSLCTIYETLQLDFPMEELKAFLPELQEGSRFLIACERLWEVQGRIKLGQFELSDCFLAERQLTHLLHALHFLAAYKMVSVKTIAYEEMRHNPPRYLHTFSDLNSGNTAKGGTEQINYVDTPASTDSIILFKDSHYQYQDGINLFPFIIDDNALNLLGGTKVCFYSGQDVTDEVLKYKFKEGEEAIEVPEPKPTATDLDLNELMKDPEKRKAFKRDAVWMLFQAAKKTLTPSDDPEFDNI